MSEAVIASGEVGAGVKYLEKLSEDKDAATASSAQDTLEAIVAWKTKVDGEIGL